MQQQITLKPSSLIVLEGLDATGKTTQLERLDFASSGMDGVRLFGDNPPMFTRQPGGFDALGAEIYKITEEMEINSPWCRQFLHLASHANHYENHIIPALDSGQSVIMDRCWWSTVAYGYFGGELNEQMTVWEYIGMAMVPAQGRMPHVVFCFMDPHQDDRHNTPAVRVGYEWLVDTHHLGAMSHLNNTNVISVPKMTVDDTTKFIFEVLVELDLAA